VLADRVRGFIDEYNCEVDRYKRSGADQPVDDFVRYEGIKWSRDLKLDLQRGNYAVFEAAKIRKATYRPFCRRYLFFDRILNEEVYVNPSIFPTPAAANENQMIGLTSPGSEKPFMTMAGHDIVDLHLVGAGAQTQCFPFYVYDEDGANRHENITDWALERFREYYNDKEINKWDIFYYVYAVLHHPEYRTKYAENLKRELPRIPLVGACHSEERSDEESRSAAETSRSLSWGQSEILRCAQDDGERAQHDSGEAQDDRDVFWAFARAGKELAHLHIDYEKLEPYPLKFIETGCSMVGADGVRPRAERRSALWPADLKVGATIPLSYRVEDKMRLSKDRRSLKVNDSLTLAGIPREAFEYRLGNRSALDWVIDQYQVTEDKRSGIRSDPNRADDPEYIVRLVGQVIYVSLETVRIVRGLPPLCRFAFWPSNGDRRLVLWVTGSRRSEAGLAAVASKEASVCNWSNYMNATNLIAVLGLLIQGGVLWAVVKYTRVTSDLFSLQSHQGFENKFFQLLQFHHDIVRAIRVQALPPGGQATEGRPAFTVLYQRLLGKYHLLHKRDPGAATTQLAQEAYDQLFEEYQDVLGHYFRNLYHLIKFIDRSDEQAADKSFYAHLVRAQMSSDELLLLLYNGASRFGKDKFHPLITRYSLLKNMPEDEVISRRLKLPGDDMDLYPSAAFGRR